MDLFIQGLMLGYGVALPIGPLMILIMQYALRGFKFGLSLGLGAMSADLIFFTLLSFGLLGFVKNELVLKILGGFGAGFMLYLAFSIFKSATKISLNSTQKGKENIIKCFIKGFLLNGINPFVLIFWLSVSSFVATTKSAVFAMFGVILGIFSTIFFVVLVVSRLGHTISLRTARLITQGSALLILAFALIMIYNTFIKGF